ncbi:MAG: flagellar motor switch protein FliN [Bacillota bacterium]|nr:flagellar motor switch protein FliN [Bacillota bacterium]
MDDSLLSQEEIDALRRSLEQEERTPGLPGEAAEALADLFARSLEEALHDAAPGLLDAGAEVDGEAAPPSQAASAARGRRVNVSVGGQAGWEAILWLGNGVEPAEPLFDAWSRRLAEALAGVLSRSVELRPGEGWAPGGPLPAEPVGFVFRWLGGGQGREAGLVAPLGSFRNIVETATRPASAGGSGPEEAAAAARPVEAPAAQVPAVREPAAREPAAEPAPPAPRKQAGTAGASTSHVWQQLGAPRTAQEAAGLELLYDVPLEISVELGRATKSVREVLALGAGSVVELDRAAGEPVDILVNGKLVAHGEVVVVDDNFGIRVTDILSPADRLRQLG